tara:strand:+ start:305 stop:868 length:564 start_codon:yes stop_codon:yes gene_type:complete
MIFKRNILLLCSCFIYIILNISLSSILFDEKVKEIESLELEHKDVNEKYITAQILSQSLEKVYTIFENNLSLGKKDEKNKEASMVFLKELTDILETLNIKLDQIVPGKKEKKGKVIKIPYQLQFKCDYEKLGEFITEIEKNNRIILIDQLILKNDIDKTRSNKNENVLEQDIEMKIYTVTLNKSKAL